jgi:hypothetical protein
VLARLTQAEAQIELVEQERLSRVEVDPVRGSHSSPQLPTDGSRIPDLHTAAGHKILQYWPRLRVKLTPDLEPFTFLKTADHEDKFLTSLALDAEQDFELLPTIQALEKLYDNLFNLPLSFVDLVKTSAHFSREHILAPFFEARLQSQATFDLRNCPLESLLV